MTIRGRITAAIAVLSGKAPVGTVTSADFGRERGWYSASDGPLLGSFQRDIHVDRHQVTANWAFFACVTLIASDMGKIGLRLVEKVAKTWQEAESSAFSPVLRKPNGYQTRQQFVEAWILSKLNHGNTYVLKERDQRGVVVRLYVLDPRLVTPLVTREGEVFYRLAQDNLSGIAEDVDPVPASEIIHDRTNCLFHPLVGISPIYACGLAAMQGLKIQQNSATFFQNMSRPSGILTTPGELTDDLADTYRSRWNKNYGGDKVGSVAVLGNGLSYQAVTSTALDSQMVEQLKITAEMVCSTLHVPSFKIGAGVIPAGQKVEDLNQIYYSDCLQAHMEAIENLMDEGLGIDTPVNGRQLGTEFNLDDLLKMDSASMVEALNKGVAGGWMKPNEARAKRGYLPVKGGDTPYLQMQNFALAALAKRDALPNPFVLDKPTPNPTPSATGPAVTADPAAPASGKAIEDVIESAVSPAAATALVEFRAGVELAMEQREAEADRARAAAVAAEPPPAPPEESDAAKELKELVAQVGEQLTQVVETQSRQADLFEAMRLQEAQRLAEQKAATPESVNLADVRKILLELS